MAQYTVIQDIEAEDKFVGPLTLKQFIYAAITVGQLYICFLLITHNAWPLTLLLLPTILFFGFLAFPWGRDQPTEIWLLAKLRFLLKPHRRVWDQTGQQELVTITAPKKVEANRTNGLSQSQVKSRLEALAQTIDTRGWAVKGLDVNMYANPGYATTSSDRLVDVSVLSPSTPVITDVKAEEDILDVAHNPVAQQMDQLVKANDEAHRQSVLENMQQIRAGHPLQGTTMPLLQTDPVAAYGHTAVLQPRNHQTPSNHTKAAPPTNPLVTPSKNSSKPDILQLAHNDDLSVATIARQANKATHQGDNEVVISLR